MQVPLRGLLLELLFIGPATTASAGKCPLCSVLSIRAPNLISDARLVTSWMDNRAPIAGCALLTIMLIDSLIKSLELSTSPLESIQYLYDSMQICETLGINGTSLQKLEDDSSFENIQLSRDITLGAFSSKYDDEEIKDEDDLLERQLVGEEVTRRIDDPIRMYLTQMGQIPLLTRKSEITLARKIEIARMAFRRKMLQSDYCARSAVELFQYVHNGTMSFDRTIKVGTEHPLTKNIIKKTKIKGKKIENE